MRRIFNISYRRVTYTASHGIEMKKTHLMTPKTSNAHRQSEQLGPSARIDHTNMRQVVLCELVQTHIPRAVAAGVPALPEKKSGAQDVLHGLVRPGVSVEHVRRKLFM